VKVHNDGGPAALMGRLVLQVAGAAEPVSIDIDTSWKFSKERPQDWESDKLDPSGWPAAKEVAPLGAGPWGKPAVKTLVLPPPPMLRKSFSVSKPVKRATVYASALGIYELHLNGQRVGKVYFTPGWTNYHKRVYYNTYDVTSQLKRGANALGALLGDGWYCGYYAWGQKSQWYGKDPRLMVQLEVEYEDGSSDRIVTDESWKCAYGPWREGDLIMGAAYDARRELAGWDEPGLDDSNWRSAAVSSTGVPPVSDEHGRDTHATAKIGAYPGDPVRTQEELPAKSVNEPVPGMYVFDLGQNMVGWARFRLSGLTNGQTLRFRYSEMLNDDGTPYTVALRGARVTDHYTARGTGEEIWEPIFTSHGFRYVEITGLTRKPELETVTGIVANADMTRTGFFECSNPAVNQLLHNIIWGQKGNYFEVPTDCPQRDERLGWTGDAQFFVPTAAYNFDVAAFFTKWLVDLDTDAQYDDGSFADVAPDLTGGHGNVAWGDAGVVCPYTIYQTYGDTRIIEQHYAQMTRYIDYLQKTSKNFIRGQGAYGDWVNLGGGAKSEVIGTAYFCYVSRLMSEMAAAIGKDEDAAKYKKLADDIRDAFAKNFVADDGSIKESSQTGYALGFTMDLIPESKRKAAADRFVGEIEKKNFHLATGFIGTPRLLPGLTMAGRNDLAYRLFLTDTFPSWLYQVKLGSTTMWERWDGWTPDKGFQDPAMNSFNHYAFGSVGQWMYRTVGGIEPDAPGFKKITLRPMPGPGLEFARAQLDSIRGTIASEWRTKKDGTTSMKFTVPPNTTATVYLPAKDATKTTESGKPIGEAQGVKFLWTESEASAYQVGSGLYDFEIKR
jgi:alpha-L-rhamnosidase